MAETSRAARVNACHVPSSFDAQGHSDAPDPEPNPGHGDPRRALMLAILERALADCRAPTARSPGASGAMLSDRQESMAFLTDQRGPRARWRHELLHLCGLDVSGFDRGVAAERHSWPALDSEADAAARERQRLYQAQYHQRKQRERRREQARECMRAKRARERPQPQSYSRRALAMGTSLTFPTFRD